MEMRQIISGTISSSKWKQHAGALWFTEGDKVDAANDDVERALLIVMPPRARFPEWRAAVERCLQEIDGVHGE